MIYDLETALNKYSPLRKFLMTDNLPVMCCSLYDMEDNQRVIYLSNKKNSKCGVDGCEFSTQHFPPNGEKDKQQLLLPAFEKSVSATVKKVDKMPLLLQTYKIYQSYLKYETDLLLGMLGVVSSDQEGYHSCHSDYKGSTACLNHAFRMIEQYNICTRRILTNQYTLDKLKSNKDLSIDKDLWTADVILLKDKRLNDKVYCFADKDYTGALVIQDNCVMHGLKTTAWYNAGCFINAHAVSVALFDI